MNKSFSIPALFLFPHIFLFAQEIPVSSHIEVVDEKKFFLHNVEEDQRLPEIAKAYQVTLNDLLNEYFIEGTHFK